MTTPSHRKNADSGPRNRVDDHDPPADGEPKVKLLDPASVAFEFQRITRTLEIERRVEQHPYGMVAAALGIGFVVGGGLFRPFAANLFRTALKVAFQPLAQQALVGLIVKLATEEGTPGEKSRAHPES